MMNGLSLHYAGESLIPRETLISCVSPRKIPSARTREKPPAIAGPMPAEREAGGFMAAAHFRKIKGQR